jgi:ApbE superfamily uncharacterized protein (UPF0280 family)
MTAVARLLPDGRRLHLQHGPIDMIVEAWGSPEAVASAYRAAAARFAGLLDELVAELPELRSPHPRALLGPVARAMAAAVAPFRPAFVTPMAAVAGADADAVLAAMVASGGLSRAYVNNGGDIALHVAPGECLTAAVAARPGLPDRVEVSAQSPVRGVATSGWRGRSWSLGIADAVTVLARTAAEADAAATMVANAVDLPGHPAVARRPGCEMQADSDLGDRLVTTAVGPLSHAEVAAALDHGLAAAEAFRARGLLVAAALFLQGEVRLCGPLPAVLPENACA